MVRRAAILCALTVSLAVDVWGVEAETARRGGESLVSNWHVGPFFEYRRADNDATFWAVRPFWSQVRDDSTRTFETDAVWPLFTMHNHADASWWSALVLLHGDSRATDSSWSFNAYPFWFSGSDRNDEGYWGFFPFYGNHPHFLLMDDWSFVLWPIWHSYEVKGVRSKAVCWPFITWRDEPREGVGVWPFYGYSRHRESMHRYVLWPFVTWAGYDEDRDTSGAGYSWWALPFYGEVRRARESQTMILPPFFSYTETFPNPELQIPNSKRWRLPWPFVDIETSSRRDRISVWPIWEQVRGYSYSSAKPEEHTWRFGWKLMENTELETDRTFEKRFNFFPFFTWERRWVKNTGNLPVKSNTGHSSRLTLHSSYFRIWPFWSSQTVKGRTRRRTLELMPIRHSEGIERNWTPFWSLWESDDRPDGRTRYSLLWNFISWQ